MSSREVIAFALAFIAGFGGLAGVLVWSDIVDALNTRRPAEDQIPFAFTSRQDFAWARKNYPYPHWKMLREFRQQNPESQLYRWYVISIVWMACFFAAAVVVFLILH